MKSGNLNFLETSGPLLACNGTALTLPTCPRFFYQSIVNNPSIHLSLGLPIVFPLVTNIEIYVMVYFMQFSVCVKTGVTALLKNINNKNNYYSSFVAGNVLPWAIFALEPTNMSSAVILYEK